LEESLVGRLHMKKILQLSILSVICLAPSLKSDITIHRDGIEFNFSKEELKEIKKLSKRSWDNITEQALMGDAVALYALGLAYLSGKGGVTIDNEMANFLFSKSAALGYPPALERIRNYYLFEEKNIILASVYTNLMISFGHQEYIRTYYNLRKEILECYGEKESIEIEKTTKELKKVIDCNKKKLKEVVFFSKVQ
jgi:hypothetical protein